MGAIDAANRKQAKRIAELEGALENIRDEKHLPECGDIEPIVAPGGHECSCPQKWARAALANLEVK